MTGAHRWLIAAGAGILAFALLTPFDDDIVRAVANPELRDQSWRWAFKQVGDLRFWVVVAVIALAWKRDWRWPAGLLGAAAAGGGIAELAKLVFGRERPMRDFVLQLDHGYIWKEGPLGPFLAGFWDSSNLGLPSSHAAVAFGGAWMLGLLDAKLRVPALVLASICAVTRVLAGAHFPTDVLLGAAIGIACAALIARLGQPKPPPADSAGARAPDAGTIDV